MARIGDLHKVLRPRERLWRYGAGKLSNSELLAIILRTGRRGENAVELANRILKRYGRARLPEVTAQDLKEVAGLGFAKAAEIAAVFELGRRLLKGKRSTLYLNPRDVWKALHGIRDNKKEHFAVFFLDARSEEIRREVVSIGTLTESLVHPREVFEPAVRHLASHIIAAHNHPSGDAEPSAEDAKITKRLVECGRVLGIELVDHVIVTKAGFFSFRENGLIVV